MSFIEKVCLAFQSANINYAVVGGYAVALHGAVRGTVDIDFVLQWSKESLFEAERVLNGLGLVSKLPVSAQDIFEFRQEYIDNRNLVAWNFYNPHDLSEQVDIIITYQLKNNVSQTIKVGDVPIKVLKINELIKMKKQSGREQDIEDITALEKLI